MQEYGFSLIELAVVLVVVSFLLGGLLVPLSTQLGQRDRETTTRQLDEIREAILGYTIVNSHLPCPFIPDATTSNPDNPGYGVANTSCSTSPTTEGILPWKTLGLNAGIDAWGHPRSSASDPWNGYFRYRVDRKFADSTNLITLSTPFGADDLAIRDSTTPDSVAGCNPSTPNVTLLTTTTENPIAIVYSTGPDLTPNAENATFESTSGCYEGGGITSTFDDMTIWIARPVLFNRMVAAGRLP